MSTDCSCSLYSGSDCLLRCCSFSPSLTSSSASLATAHLGVSTDCSCSHYSGSDHLLRCCSFSLSLTSSSASLATARLGVSTDCSCSLYSGSDRLLRRSSFSLSLTSSSLPSGSSFCVDRLFLFPIFRNQPPIVLLVVYCFPYTWIIMRNSTTLSPPCQTQCSRISTYHNIIFPLKILKCLVAKLWHIWLHLLPIWLHLLPIWLRCRCASLMSWRTFTFDMYGCV